MVSIPYSLEINDRHSLEINDRPAFDRYQRSAAQFEQVIRDQFDVLCRESGRTGKVMAIALHPYLIGVAHRIAALERALA